jgi:hypothetical protein
LVPRARAWDERTGTLNGLFDLDDGHSHRASRLILDPATGVVLSH